MYSSLTKNKNPRPMKKITILLSTVFAIALLNLNCPSVTAQPSSDKVTVDFSFPVTNYHTSPITSCTTGKVTGNRLVSVDTTIANVHVQIPSANANTNPQNINTITIGGDAAKKDGGNGMSTQDLLYTILAIIIAGLLIAGIVYMITNRRRNLFPYYGEQVITTITNGGGGRMKMNHDMNGNPNVEIEMFGTTINSLELAKLPRQQQVQPQQANQQPT